GGRFIAATTEVVLVAFRASFVVDELTAIRLVRNVDPVPHCFSRLRGYAREPQEHRGTCYRHRAANRHHQRHPELPLSVTVGSSGRLHDAINWPSLDDVV